MLWVRSGRFAEQGEHRRQRGLEADTVRAENFRNRRVPIVEIFRLLPPSKFCREVRPFHSIT